MQQHSNQLFSVQRGRGLLVLGSALLLSACGSNAEPERTASQAPADKAPPPAVVDLDALHSDAPSIDWFKGDVDAAFTAATSASKPVFLYWGAQWCPPCKQLKSSVFSRPDFIAKSRSFIPVYLDGDLPNAQKWGDEFRVTGYPTVVIFKPDRTEITRLSGGMDLSLYAAVLDNVLGDVRPVRDVLALAAAAKESLAADDCRRLAFHAFGLEDGEVFSPELLANGFESAALRCPTELTRERARFQILAAGRVARLEAAALAAGKSPSTRLRVLIAKVADGLKDQELALANSDVLSQLGPEFFGAARLGTPQLLGTLRDRWMSIANAAAGDARFAPADQLAAQLLKINAAKAFAPDGKVTTDIASVAVNAAGEMLAENHDSYVRASVVNSAINIYLALDDLPRARDLLAAEAKTSSNPHYYLGDLADVEEKLGNTERAIELYAEAYNLAKGPASRFQWGFNYLSGLVRMRPDDSATIERVGTAVLGELSGPDSVHRRTRGRLERLDTQLRAWDSTAPRAAVIVKLRQQFDSICRGGTGGKVQSGASASEACPAFLQTKAA